jgi:mycothione reductase
VDAAGAARLGVTFAQPTVDWPGIRDRIFGRLDAISAGGRAYRDLQAHTTVYAAHARFTGPRQLALSTGEVLTADRGRRRRWCARRRPARRGAAQP